MWPIAWPNIDCRRIGYRTEPVVQFCDKVLQIFLGDMDQDVCVELAVRVFMDIDEGHGAVPALEPFSHGFLAGHKRRLVDGMAQGGPFPFNGHELI